MTPAPKPSKGRVFAKSHGLLTNKALELVFGKKLLPLPARYQPQEGDSVTGWGIKANTEASRAFAEKHGLVFTMLEDGFLGYLSHPAHGSPLLSVITDHTGIYYDAAHPNDLETAISSRASSLSSGEKDRIQALRSRIIGLGASKYNLSRRGQTPIELPDDRPAVLVVDQTLGDRSVRLGLGTADSFASALTAALSDYPDHHIVIKTHPDVLAGIKEGYLSPSLLPATDQERIIFLASTANIYDVFDRVDAVYTVTSQMGFEALIAGKKVITFGWPIYAGWGLTDDRGHRDGGIIKAMLARRQARPDLDAMLTAMLLDYPTYIDPFRACLTNPDRILDLIEAEMAIARPGSDIRFKPMGFSLWKRSFLPAFLPRGSWRQKRETPLLWGRKPVEPGCDNPWRMEDGFLRSVGLGSDLKRPASLVLDKTGLYFDATGPSDLETYFKTSQLSKAGEKRAEKLLETMRASQVSKYNLGEIIRPDFRRKAAGRRVILVPGQVESDASIRYGSQAIKSNTGLVEAVRRDNPEAYILYKPHPDVTSGNREADQGDPSAFADDIIVDVDITQCFEAVDEVHTMTSLAGFEALVRGVKVVTYGMPFYAGWGLTTDFETCDRRGRALSLHHLVYGALIAYPRYFSWRDRKPVGPEEILAEIALARQSQKKQPARPNYFLRWAKKIFFLIEALLRY